MPRWIYELGKTLEFLTPEPTPAQLGEQACLFTELKGTLSKYYMWWIGYHNI